GATAIDPVNKVMDLETVGRVTRRVHTRPAVTMQHDAASAFGNDPLRAPDVDRQTLLSFERRQMPVTSEQAEQFVGHRRAIDETTDNTVRIASGVDEHIDPKVRLPLLGTHSE